MWDTAWTVLSTTPQNQKNAVFTQLYPDEETYRTAAAQVSIRYTPYLWDILQDSRPPTIEQFKQFREFRRTDRIWGIYLLILEKDGRQPKIYIGSGTESLRGLQRRMVGYDAGINGATPQRMTEALLDGYEISHKLLLCWTPLPDITLQPRLRALFITIEAAFGYLLWAMYTIKKDFGMSSICPWEHKKLEYQGLCTHCCLNETVGGDLSLSAEELLALVKQRRDDHNTSNKKSVDKIRKAKKY